MYCNDEKAGDVFAIKTPVIDYPASALLDELPVYRNRKSDFDLSRLVIDSGEYDLYIVALPANEENSTIPWKQTYRDQISVPPGSLLLMIAIEVEGA